MESTEAIKNNSDPLTAIGSQKGENYIVAFLKYALFAFLLVHLFGLFGIFISLAYPLLGFFFPSKIWCFFCLHQSLVNGDKYCKVCDRPVYTIYNPPFKSIIVNTIVMLMMSIMFMLLLFGEIVLINSAVLVRHLSPGQAEFVYQDNVDYKVGQEFTYDIKISAISQAINVIKSELSFDNEVLEVIDISTDKSFATIFTQKEFSNVIGSISIVGGIPSPGYIGEDGFFARIKFIAKKPGLTELQFNDSCRILANDGNGTNILQGSESVPLLIAP